MKKWKIVLTIVVLILAVGAGAIYYFLNIKEYKTADRKVAEIVQADYNIKLPDEEGNNNTSSEENAQKPSDENNEPGTQSDNKNTSEQQTNNKTVSPSKDSKQSTSKPTAAFILAKYQPSFENLESQANGKIDSLLSYAFNEYQTKKANNEDISYFYFYSKYNSAANTLEASTDASFNYIYNVLVSELTKSGYSTSEAKPIKDHYTSLKKQRRSALMSKAMANAK